MTFGDRVKALIKAKRMSQQEFADFTGEHKQRVSRVVTNAAVPNYSFAESVLNAFPDLSSEWLCRGNGSMWLSEMSKTSGPADLPVSGQKEDADISWKELVGEVKQLRADLDKVKRK